MSADKRSVHTDALETLGTIIGDGEARDAIHLAVEPVIAGEPMAPGTHILIEDGKAVPALFGKAVGIVDPFLERFVKEGERFWLVVYPRKITSLRHVWTHPDFDDVAADILAPVNDKAASEAWLREFIAGADCPGYEEVIGKAVSNDSWDSDYLHFDDLDAHGEIPLEFWDHVEVVTGRKIESEDRASYFSCSC